MVLLIVVGFTVGATRNDSSNRPGVVLRADEQALRPQATLLNPSTTVPLASRPPSPDGPLPTPGRRDTPTRPAPKATTTATATASPTSTTTIKTSAFAPNRIAYSASGSMWTVDPDGLDPRSIATSGYFPAWSTDHRLIAYTDADSPGGALWVLNASGGRFGLTTGVAQDAQPTWSPDGTKIAFARVDNTSTDAYSSIWVVHSDGSMLHPIATSRCFNRDPSWSPDGTKIAFWSSRDHCGDDGEPDTGEYELYVLNLLNNETTRLLTSTSSGTPAWSPDSKTIAFSSDGYGGAGTEVVLIGGDGNNARRITNASGDDSYPAWSPDGGRLAFRSDRGGGGIFTMKPDGSDVQLVVAGGYQPSWR